jgi:hypothetical protein
MKLAGLKLHSAVCIAVKEWKFYCSVWPSSCHIAQDFVHLDTSVVCNTENFTAVGSLFGCDLDLLNDITPVKVCTAKRVEVSVYTRVENVQTLPARVMYNKTRCMSQVQCILQDKVFTKHCWVCVKKILNYGSAFMQEIDRIFINNVEYYNCNEVG